MSQTHFASSDEPNTAENAANTSRLLITDPRIRRLISTLLIVAVLAGTAMLVLNWRATSWDFRNNLWGPAYQLIHGKNPYLLDDLFRFGNPIWMPTIIGALFPLGWLTEHQATALWFLASLLCLVVIYRLSTRPSEGQSKVSLGLMTGLLIGGFGFVPTISHLVLGQFSLFAVVLMLLAVYAVQRRQWVLTGILIALATAKPQLILLPVLGLAVYAWHQGRWSALLRLGLSGTVTSAVLTLPLWIASPDWLNGMQIAFSRNLQWAQPSSLVAFRFLMGDGIGIALWGLLLVVAIIITVWMWGYTSRSGQGRHIDPITAMSWNLMLTLLVSPYAWTWDFVLILPLWFRLMAITPSWWARGVLLLGYVVTWGGAVAIRLSTDSDEIRFWWFPWIWLMTFVLAALLQGRTHPQAEVAPDISALWEG